MRKTAFALCTGLVVFFLAIISNSVSAEDSYALCAVGYTGNHQCSGDYLQQQYQYEDCSTTWFDQEYCSYGCSNGYCLSYSSYTPGYTNSYQCSGNYRQRQYINSDYSTTWVNQEYCTYGCSNGYCLSYGGGSGYPCTAQYLSNYQCSGNYKQQQYRNSDCSYSWTNQEYCTYGCSGGYCLNYNYPSSANIYASVSTPGNVYFGNMIYTIVSLSNSGAAGTYVNFNAYVCRYDGSGCVSMSCSPSSSTYLSGYGTASASCYSSANDYSYHNIRFDYSWSGYTQTINSGQFNVLGGSGYPCTAQYLSNYQCSGNYRQRQYQNYDCSYTWTNQEYCTYGCSNGYCASQSGCSPQYTGNYQCSGNVRQRQYQNSDCSYTWNNVETCSNGCSNGACQSSSSCSSQQLSNYRCDGNNRQRQYQSSDCSTAWSNVEYCSNGCSNGFCNSYTDYTYSYASQSCSAQYLNNYQCSGAMRQRQYQSSDCSTTWSNVETCLYGCSNGFCSSPPFQTGISIPSGCDLSISMNYDTTLQKGLSAVVSGYVKDQNGNFLRIPFKFYASDEFVVGGQSNEFGYWQAGFTPTTTGKKEFKIVIPGCNVKKTGEITVTEKVSALKKAGVSVYPTSIDTQPGKDSLLVIESELKGIQVKIDGIPAGWLNPSEFTIEDDKSYVHINPVDAATGIYELNITGYSDGQVAFNKKVSFFVSRKAFFGAQEDGQDWISIIVSRILDLSGLIVLVIIAYIALVLYNRGYRISLDVPRLRNKQTYLNDVKRKIEQDVTFE